MNGYVGQTRYHSSTGFRARCRARRRGRRRAPRRDIALACQVQTWGRSSGRGHAGGLNRFFPSVREPAGDGVEVIVAGVVPALV